MSGAWYILYLQLEYRISEPEITIHGCPDKVSDQILKFSDILRYGQTLLQCMQILAHLFANYSIVKYIVKCNTH